MRRLLSIEFIKLWNSRSSRFLIIAYFVLLTFIALIAAIKFDIGPIEFHLAEQGIFNFPFIWHFNTYIAAVFKLFLAIVIVSMMANEYSNKTLKQNLIDGLSKKEFVMSKFLTVVMFSGISTVFIFVVSLVLGLIYSDFTEVGIIFSQLGFLLAYFLKLTAFFSFCLFLGMLVKRSAFALGFLVLWNILEGIVYAFLKFKVFDNSTIADSIAQFFPLNAMSNLIKEPFTRLGAVKSVAAQIGEEFTKNYAVQWYDVLIVTVWIFVFVYGTLFILRKRDL